MTHIDADSPEAAVQRLHAALGLPSGFFASLLKEDDWSFVIKLHALIESALAHVVAHRLGDEVADVVGLLDMGERKGKVAFAAALKLIDEQERYFLKLLSSIRNRCAHGVQQAVRFSLETYIAGLDSNGRREFFRACNASDPRESITISNLTTNRQKFASENPKLWIWMSALYFLAALYMQKETAEFIRRSERSIIEVSRLTTSPLGSR
ncbi:hypothetical protein [Paraburkholderia nemoris]|uniref:hypothetical protein n=1 Tax=Paraburkholderia nemoris TaxID=2793076 RepID=UPI0038B6EC35